MSNAAKHRKKAAEFEQLKQIDRAIASYIRAIEDSETEGEDVDVALLNKVGDLTLRQGRVADAVTYYERAVEHYATAGLFNNAIALCNKILRSAPGRSNVYFTLGRICARKGLRGDATRNFLEYATRMQQESRVDEGMRALAEVADLMPELTEIRSLVEEHAIRAGIALPRRKTPAPVAVTESPHPFDNKSSELVFLDLGSEAFTARNTPPLAPRVQTPARPVVATPGKGRVTPVRTVSGGSNSVSQETQSLDDFLLFDPSVPGAVTPADSIQAIVPAELPLIDVTPVHGLDTAEGAIADLVGEVVVEAVFVPPVDVQSEADIEATAASVVIEEADAAVAPIEGLEVSGEFAGVAIDVVEGFVSDGIETPVDAEAVEPEVALTWLMPPDSAELTDAIGDDDASTVDASTVDASTDDDAGDAQVDVLAGLMIEAFDHVADAQTTRRPPFRLDPHDFILPGELPPLMVEDDLAFAGMQFAIDAVDDALASTSTDSESAQDVSPESVDAWLAATDASDASGTSDAQLVEPVDALPDEAVAEPEPDVLAEAEAAADADAAVDAAAEEDAESMLRDAIESDRAVRTTPSLHIAAVAAEANAVATSRRDELHAAVARTPHDWTLRRRLAEALFEVGEREGALAELQTAVSGFVQAGDLEAAAEIADQLVRIAPERIPYHQKRVELAVRLSDQQRLRAAYLDLADTLVRMGDDVRAHAVYARVLEIDPWDERARAALGAAAPPPPPKPAEAPSDDFVDLAEWLRDDEPATTRMRMREPQVSGDEQADFDTLLRHFKDGVARSLGEEDFESHYDLGVAYKEMGLLDDAIAEFQKALRSRRHRLPAYEALGQCFVEQSRHSVAATVLSRALHEPGPGDEHRVGVLYLLAYSCEALQRWDEARSYYSRVYATDIHFRDVAARLAALDLIAR